MSRRQIREIKTTLTGERQVFDCELLRASDDEAVVVYRMPADRMLEDILLPEGTLSLGYFREGQAYNAYHWVDNEQNTLALYFNICDCTLISEDSIAWRDLAVDLLISPQGLCRVLDEDELPEDLEPELLEYIHATCRHLCAAPLSRLAEYDKLSRELINPE